MAGFPALFLFVIVGTLSASPINLLGDADENEISSHLFRELGKVIEKFGAHPDNETKPDDLDIESSDSFKFGPDQMRKLIANKMMGAENVPSKRILGSVGERKDGKAFDHDHEDNKDDAKKKEMKMAEQIGCSDASDCNSTSYCNKLSYTCVKCRKVNDACDDVTECCGGFVCDQHTHTCAKKTKASKCSSSSECGGEQCCALNDNGDGECRAHLKEGAECGNDPFTSFFSSQSLFEKGNADLPDRCPCEKQLTCEKGRAFLFADSPTCTKKKSDDRKTTKTTTTATPHHNHDRDHGKPQTANRKPHDHKSIIKITLRSSPLLRFHSSDDESDPLSALSGPLTSLLPKTLVKLLGKPPMRRGFTVKISSRKPGKLSSPMKLSSLSRPFPFFPFPFSNPFSEIRHEMTSQKDISDDVESERERRKIDEDDDNKDGERRKMVDDVADEARASVHRAVDGIFDTIMKKITKINKE